MLSESGADIQIQPSASYIFFSTMPVTILSHSFFRDGKDNLSNEYLHSLNSTFTKPSCIHLILGREAVKHTPPGLEYKGCCKTNSTPQNTLLGKCAGIISLLCQSLGQIVRVSQKNHGKPETDQVLAQQLLSLQWHYSSPTILSKFRKNL